jgi:hypothetical protein
MPAFPLTRVLTRERTHRSLATLVFGTPFSEERGADESGTEIVRLFTPGSVFCIVWWRRIAHRRQHRALAILESATARTLAEPMNDIHPGAVVHVFIDQYGPAGVDGSIDELLDLIRRFRERDIEPEHVSARYWRHASRRILRGFSAPELADGDYPASERSA